MVEIAFNHGNKDEAYAAIDKAFRDAQPEEITLASPLNALGIPQRAVMPLERRGVMTIGAVCGWSITDLLDIPNFGRAYVRMIEEALARHGWSLRCDLVDGVTNNRPLPSGGHWSDRLKARAG